MERLDNHAHSLLTGDRKSVDGGVQISKGYLGQFPWSSLKETRSRTPSSDTDI